MHYKEGFDFIYNLDKETKKKRGRENKNKWNLYSYRVRGYELNW